MSARMHTIATLIDLLRAHKVTHFEFASGSTQFKWTQNPADQADSASTARVADDPHLAEVLSPGVGMFVARHPLMPREMTAIGDSRQRGECVALIKIGMIYRPVLAPCAGKIVKRMCRPGDLVDYNRPLFLMQPNAA
jgi:acetyl-CoA carboxylase biotin carboxyl carrier protein